MESVEKSERQSQENAQRSSFDRLSPTSFKLKQTHGAPSAATAIPAAAPLALPASPHPFTTNLPAHLPPSLRPPGDRFLARLCPRQPPRLPRPLPFHPPTLLRPRGQDAVCAAPCRQAASGQRGRRWLRRLCASVALFSSGRGERRAGVRKRTKWPKTITDVVLSVFPNPFSPYQSLIHQQPCPTLFPHALARPTPLNRRHSPSRPPATPKHGSIQRRKPSSACRGTFPPPPLSLSRRFSGLRALLSLGSWPAGLAASASHARSFVCPPSLGCDETQLVKVQSRGLGVGSQSAVLRNALLPLAGFPSLMGSASSAQ